MKISDSEKYIMDVLWKSSPLTAKDIIDKLDKSLEWQDKTVKTLINRLLKKEVIGFEKQGRQYLYFPQMAESEYVEEASDSFVERVFKGNVKSLIAAFAKSEKLSQDDIKELKSLVNQLDNKKGE
ncbi:BlaI/MecI/CopY family transcriptional regulator [Pleionea sp. CnH1-48]|uniref:BlaI/MecI/CopY family transcriptional regulator n=1 Tax=Pleionea sp. CnH1-48 TaxID=2954494 RepID=UPI00209837AC|nr:BlaI/MecI/CopY family transcriptional regulator [Pleionea sp. CnH1-48]MCO7224357.1 BlaI/MecI/CopY family transcriptional regulator [Pleionea sp. CnH1-48]